VLIVYVISSRVRTRAALGEFGTPEGSTDASSHIEALSPDGAVSGQAGLCRISLKRILMLSSRGL